MKRIFLTLLLIVSAISAEASSCIKISMLEKEVLKNRANLRSLDMAFSKEIGAMKDYNDAWKYLEERHRSNYENLLSSNVSYDELVAHLIDDVREDISSKEWGLAKSGGILTGIGVLNFILAQRINHAIAHGSKNKMFEAFLTKILQIEHNDEDKKKGRKIKTLFFVSFALYGSVAIYDGYHDIKAINALKEKLKSMEKALNDYIVQTDQGEEVFNLEAYDLLITKTETLEVELKDAAAENKSCKNVNYEYINRL